MTRGTVLDWLASRTPVPPAALAWRLQQVLRAYPDEGFTGQATVAAVMGALGLATLGSLAGRDPRSTDVALDLLAADALVTFAFEAAAEEGVEVETLARNLIARAAA